MKTITGRPLVTVHQDLTGGYYAVLPIDDLPPVPQGAAHSWPARHVDIEMVSGPLLWFRMPITVEHKSVSSDELRESAAVLAHRLAAATGYTGHLEMWQEPLVDLVRLGVLAFPVEPFPEVCG